MNADDDASDDDAWMQMMNADAWMQMDTPVLRQTTCVCSMTLMFCVYISQHNFFVGVGCLHFTARAYQFRLSLMPALTWLLGDYLQRYAQHAPKMDLLSHLFKMFATQLSQQWLEQGRLDACINDMCRLMCRLYWSNLWYTGVICAVSESHAQTTSTSTLRPQGTFHVFYWCWRWITWCHVFTQMSLSHTHKHARITQHNTRSLKCWWAPAAASMTWRYCISLWGGYDY